ncbi:hypothetical protein E3T54_11895 [Cryobacterium sp. Sr8]|uniref:hypothetical protein n=1 Tax=Cryobacterium sp. Sr8 TaxID=1259203 RepID=UPI00106B4990|nr:hypothetical protein [Cryobacterium sp. Sr8]TFD75428.1 hypothetical protein E3T54_11895 [Cryobacterium sp. Sr8]
MFALDYMGSAEFEWSTPKLSVNLIRAARKLEICERSVTRAGRTRHVQETVRHRRRQPPRWHRRQVGVPRPGMFTLDRGVAERLILKLRPPKK